MDIAGRIYKMWETKGPDWKKTIGGSDGSYECDRRVWLGYRWFKKDDTEGRIRRLFDTGNREELRIIADLEAIGARVLWKQEAFRLGVLEEYHIDGIVYDLPELMGQPALLECKSHNRKSFNDLEKKGVKESKIEHWNQMQQYMAVTHTNQALYAALCKDDERYHFELVARHGERSDYLMRRVAHIAVQQNPPPRISTDAAFFKCKMCPMHGLCHTGEQVQKSCRSCIYFRADDVQIKCGRNGYDLSHEAQKKGCANYVQIGIGT